MDIDKQRIATERALEALGYRYQGGYWLSSTDPIRGPNDVPHVDALTGCTKGLDEQVELKEIETMMMTGMTLLAAKMKLIKMHFGRITNLRDVEIEGLGQEFTRATELILALKKWKSLIAR
jgi:hypothetical protein